MRLINTNLLNYFYKNGVKPLKDAITNKLDSSKIADNLLTTVAGFALDARQGPVIQGQIDDINSNLSDLSNKLSSAALSDTGWTTLNSTYLTRYRYKNGIVTIFSAFNKTVSSTITIGTLPTAYWPPLELSMLDSVQGGLRLSVGSNGVVKIAVVGLSTSHDYCYTIISYPV